MKLFDITSFSPPSFPPKGGTELKLGGGLSGWWGWGVGGGLPQEIFLILTLLNAILRHFYNGFPKTLSQKLQAKKYETLPWMMIIDLRESAQDLKF